MSFESWLGDTQELAHAIPQESPVRTEFEDLIRKTALGAVEHPDLKVDYRLLDTPADTEPTFYVLRGDDPRTLNFNAHTAGARNVLARVIYGKERSALILPDHNPNSPLTNGLILSHELTHVKQDRTVLVKYRNLPAINLGTVGFAGIQEILREVGKKEREAYGLNVATLRAIDGTCFEEYTDKWEADTQIVDQYTDSPEAGIKFLEKRFKWLPSPKYYWNPWEDLGFGGKAWNLAADLPPIARSIPKPDKGTFTYELWKEGKIPRLLLKQIGRMAILEREFNDVLPEDALNQVAGLHFAIKA